MHWSDNLQTRIYFFCLSMPEWTLLACTFCFPIRASKGLLLSNFRISSWVYEYILTKGHNWDNYVLLILKYMQQIRKTDKVLHVSASNYILSDVHLTSVNAKKLLSSTSSQIIGSDCQSQNRHLTKIWSMSWTSSPTQMFRYRPHWPRARNLQSS